MRNWFGNIPWQEVCESKDLSDGLCRSGFALDLPKGRGREQNENPTDTLEVCLHFKALSDNAGCEQKALLLF